MEQSGMSDQTDFSSGMVDEMCHQHASDVEQNVIEDEECNQEEIVCDEESGQFTDFMADLRLEEEQVIWNYAYRQNW